MEWLSCSIIELLGHCKGGNFIFGRGSAISSAQEWKLGYIFSR